MIDDELARRKIIEIGQTAALKEQGYRRDLIEAFLGAYELKPGLIVSTVLRVMEQDKFARADSEATTTILPILAALEYLRLNGTINKRAADPDTVVEVLSDQQSASQVVSLASTNTLSMNLPQRAAPIVDMLPQDTILNSRWANIDLAAAAGMIGTALMNPVALKSAVERQIPDFSQPFSSLGIELNPSTIDWNRACISAISRPELTLQVEKFIRASNNNFAPVIKGNVLDFDQLVMEHKPTILNADRIVITAGRFLYQLSMSDRLLFLQRLGDFMQRHKQSLVAFLSEGSIFDPLGNISNGKIKATDRIAWVEQYNSNGFFEIVSDIVFLQINSLKYDWNSVVKRKKLSPSDSLIQRSLL